MTRWLVTGAGGQLGRDVIDVLHATGHDATGADRSALDVTDLAAVEAAVAGARADVVVNCAAWTAVDDAETAEDAAYAVNAIAPAYLARACATHGARLVHVSTDYVFAGDKGAPYLEDDPVAPRSAYGRTKAAGEQAVLDSDVHAYIVRTAWLYSRTGANFVTTMQRLAGERDSVDVVVDQVGSPTWTGHLARALVEIGASQAPRGIWHYTNDGQASWYEFAQAVFSELGFDPERVHTTTTAAFPRPAPRPAYSVLGTGKWRSAGLSAPPHWRDALHTALTPPREAGDVSSL